MIAKLALVAALAGSAAGAAVVLADEPAPAPRVPAVRTAAPTPGPPALPAAGVTIADRVNDPAGGAPWAVRRFTTTLRNGTTAECHELGRVAGDRFGWIDAAGSFKPVRAGSQRLPGDCRAPRALQKAGATLQRFTTVTADSEPLETVTFGAVAPAIRTIEPADEPPLRPSAGGVVLRIARGERGGAILTGTLVDRDGRRTRFNDVRMPPVRGGEPRPGTRFVAARAPDPAGGIPWGVIGAEGGHGRICLSAPPGLVVGTRIGYVDTVLGIFRPVPFAEPRCTGRSPTRAFPMRIDTLISSVGGDDPRGRIERRVDSARIVFSGRVHPDVVSVTIRTPRDVRTLVPSSRAHAILAVYDGRFPGGKVTATARLKDGREVTRTLYSE
jgi:hypothetical protein